MGQAPSPEACAGLIAEGLASIVNAAYDIAQAAADCTLPGLVEVSCASDLTDMMSYWFQLANDICGMTLACGDLDNTCGAQVTQAMVELSDLSTNLVAAASDCTSDSFTCTFDVVMAIDKMNSFIGRVIAAMEACNSRETLPLPGTYAWLLEEQFGAVGPSRRLSARDGGPGPWRRKAGVSLESTAIRTQASASLGWLFDAAESRGVDMTAERRRAASEEFGSDALSAARLQLSEVGRHLRAVLKAPFVFSRALIT